MNMQFIEKVRNQTKTVQDAIAKDFESQMEKNILTERFKALLSAIDTASIDGESQVEFSEDVIHDIDLKCLRKMGFEYEINRPINTKPFPAKREKPSVVISW